MPEIFKSGTLEMATSAFDSVDMEVLWMSSLYNRILCIVALALGLLIISEYFRLFPNIMESLSRWKGNMTIEHSLNLCKSRNIVFAVCALQFILIADRFELLRCPLQENLPEWSRVPFLAVSMLVFLLMRSILFKLSIHSGISSETWSGYKHSVFNYLIALTSLMLATICVLRVFGVSDEVSREVMLIETGIIYLIDIVRSTQFLGSNCSGLTTILYLCALEFLPVGIMIFIYTR